MPRLARFRRTAKWAAALFCMLLLTGWVVSEYYYLGFYTGVGLHGDASQGYFTRRTIIAVHFGEFDVVSAVHLFPNKPAALRFVDFMRVEQVMRFSKPGWLEYHQPYWQQSGLLWREKVGIALPTYQTEAMSSGEQLRRILIPFWLMLFLSMIATAYLFWKDRSRRLPGQCKQCGYNLTGNVSGVCPECGGEIVSKSGCALALMACLDLRE